MYRGARWQCDEFGEPTQDTLKRCEAELFRKHKLDHYKYTIVSGGAGRGVGPYMARQRQQTPTFHTTEAEQIIRWAVAQGEDDSTYLLEPFALDTIGNLIFSAKLLLLHGLRRPVFLSQAHHLYQIQIAAQHWFRNSDIKPEFLPVEDTDETTNVQRAFKEMQRSLSSPRMGYGFPQSFGRETLPLPSGCAWEQEETRWAFEVGIRWLFRFAEEHGKLRYRQYYNEAELLHEFGMGPRAVPLK